MAESRLKDVEVELSKDVGWNIEGGDPSAIVLSLIIVLVLLFLACALTDGSRFVLLDIWRPFELCARRLAFWPRTGSGFWERGSILLVDVSTLTVLLCIHSSYLFSCQESATRTTRAAHGMIVSRLVKIWLSSLRRQAQGIFELLAGKASLQDAMELLSVDVQWCLVRLRA